MNPDLDALFDCIKAKDWRLCGKVVNIGSYYQGLKIRHSDEFDYSVFLDVSIPHLICDTDLKAFYGFIKLAENPGYDWHKAHTIPQLMYNGRFSSLHRSLDKNLNIETKKFPLFSPGKGYHIVRFSPPPWGPVNVLPLVWVDLFFDDDLVPHLVKMRLKEVLLEVVRRSSWRFKGLYVSICSCSQAYYSNETANDCVAHSKI